MRRFALLMLALAALCCAAFAEEFQGTIADSHCAASQGAKVVAADHAKCAADCMKKGAKAVLVTDEGKIYKLDDQKKAVPLAGQKVKVDGKLSGDTIKVSKIATS